MNEATGANQEQKVTFSLRGQFLVAMPEMQDPRFAKSVVFICSHSEEEGAMGLVVNKLMPDLHFADLMAQFDIKVDATKENGDIYDRPILVGGPVETGRGFVLHSTDYVPQENAVNVSDELCLSTTMDILRTIAMGKGPSQALLALGYCGWEPGQLEGELSGNDWLVMPSSSELIFNIPADQRYHNALKSVGIDLTFLSMRAGHA